MRCFNGYDGAMRMCVASRRWTSSGSGWGRLSLGGGGVKKFHHVRLVEAQFQVGERSFQVFLLYGFANSGRDGFNDALDILHQQRESEDMWLQIWMGTRVDTSAWMWSELWCAAVRTSDDGDGQELGGVRRRDFLVHGRLFPPMPPPDHLPASIGAVVRVGLITCCAPLLRSDSFKRYGHAGASDYVLHVGKGDQAKRLEVRKRRFRHQDAGGGDQEPAAV